MYEKAMKRLADSDAALKAVEELVRDGFISEARYAGAFSRDKAFITGWGPVKIRFALAAKGIPREIIDSTLGELDRSRTDEKLLKSLTARYRLLSGDPTVKIKLLKFALSRGYDYAAAEQAVKKILD